MRYEFIEGEAILTRPTGRRTRSRANGEGTIYPRSDGRWVASPVDEAGNRRSWYGKTRKEAEKRLRAERDNQEKGLPIVDGNLTTAEYLSGWLETSERRVRPSTQKKYASLLNNHAIPYLSKIQLIKLSGQDLNRIYERCQKAGLSASSAETLHAVLHKALEDAKRKHLVHRNVADEADPYRAPRREMKTFTMAQALQFLDAVRGQDTEALFPVALTTGMRQGELLALRWKDVDLPTGRIQVTATLQRGKGSTIAEPKTPHSRRLISSPPQAKEALLAQREKVPAECEGVFPTDKGTPWDPRNLVRHSSLSFGADITGVMEQRPKRP